MYLYRIRSSNMKGVLYLAESRKLYVGFRSGYYYVYWNVAPTLYARLIRAQPHPWTRVGAAIERHPHRRVAPLPLRPEFAPLAA